MVTSDTGAWADSGTIDTGKSFSFTFTKPGTYVYHCAVHPYMTATIRVTGSTASSGAQAGTVPVKLASAHILVTAKGFTLYVFAPDSKNKSTCYESCAKFWPPLLAPSGTKSTAAVPGVPGKFGITTRTDGTLQYTYDGAPLYTFRNDEDPGACASARYLWSQAGAVGCGAACVRRRDVERE